MVQKWSIHSMIAAGITLCILSDPAGAASARRDDEVVPASHWKRSSGSAAGLLKLGFAFVTAVPYPGGYYDYFQKGARLVRCEERVADGPARQPPAGAGPAPFPPPPPFAADPRSPMPQPQEGDDVDGCRELVE